MKNNIYKFFVFYILLKYNILPIYILDKYVFKIEYTKNISKIPCKKYNKTYHGGKASMMPAEHRGDAHVNIDLEWRKILCSRLLNIN